MIFSPPTIISPHHLPSSSSSTNSLMTIRRTQRSISPPIMTKSIPRNPKPPSPVNVSHFPTEGWLSHTRPTTCVVPGRIGTVIGYEDYYIHEKHVLCTCAFSVAAVATTVNDGASPPGSTELNNETGHNCKMSHGHYKSLASIMTPGLYTALNTPSETSSYKT
jgi:hypothetical protein